MKLSLYTLILPRIELPFLEEWIGHNLSLGVDEIFIYDNGCTSTSTEPSLRKMNEAELEYKWTKKPDVDYNEHLSDNQINDELNKIADKYNGKVQVRSWVYEKDHDDKYPKSQVTGYKHCVENNPSDYWLFCDPDEFFVLQQHKTFQDLIKDDEMKDIGAFWFGSEIYEPRKDGLPIGELKTTGKIKKSKGNWRYTGCNTKCLVKSPIFWARKHDSNIHKVRSLANDSRHIGLDVVYFKHYMGG